MSRETVLGPPEHSHKLEHHTSNPLRSRPCDKKYFFVTIKKILFLIPKILSRGRPLSLQRHMKDPYTIAPTFLPIQVVRGIVGVFAV